MKKQKNNRTLGKEIATCWHTARNCLDFNIGKQVMFIQTGTAGKNKFNIVICSIGQDDDEEHVVFQHTIHLTPEEYDVAVLCCSEDWMYVDSVPGLIAKRVAKDLFSTLLMNLGALTTDELDDRHRAEWKAYTLYLLHERMAGRPVSAYLPGFEETESDNV